MENVKEIEQYISYISCVKCNKKFNKTNKPFIMFCSHNICEECKLKYSKKIKCSNCGKVFGKREIKKFPINYSILENKFLSNIEVDECKNITNNYNNDNIELQKNKFNLDNFETLKGITPQKCINFMNNADNNLIEKEEKENSNEIIKNIKERNTCEEVIKECGLVINNTFELINNLEKNFLEYINIFFDSMIDIFKLNKEVLIQDLNICQLLQESGIINHGDYIKLEHFLNVIKEINKEKLKECKSFDDIYDLIKKNKKEISYEKFISLFFFFNKIFELKIKKIFKIFDEQKKLYCNKKDNDANLIHLLTNLAQKYEIKLSDIFYDITIYRASHFIFDINQNKKIKNSLNNFYNKNENLLEQFNNIILFYEPIKKNISIQIIKINELKNQKIIDSYLLLNQILYILTDQKFYIYEIKTEKFSSFNTIENQDIEINTKIFKYDTSIMKISSKYFESINLRKDISKNEWRTKSLYDNIPGKIKKPYPVCHSADFIYVLDQEDKNINSIYLYNEEFDSWEKKEIKLETKVNDDNIKKVSKNIDKENEKVELIILKQLYLEDYFFFNKCFACIFGGRHPMTKQFNKNVYMIDVIKGNIKKIMDFNDYIPEDMIVINLNCGILNKYIDFIFLYYYINVENNIKTKIIRKEIIENDISKESSIEIIIDKNISEIVQYYIS